MTKETIGERIARLRGEMSQTDLANRIKAITGDGLSRAAISLWESGTTKSIKPENLLAVCDVFKIDPWELVYGRAKKLATHKQPDLPESELTLGDKELWLLTMYSQIPEKARRHVDEIVREMADIHSDQTKLIKGGMGISPPASKEKVEEFGSKPRKRTQEKASDQPKKARARAG